MVDTSELNQFMSDIFVAGYDEAKGLAKWIVNTAVPGISLVISTQDETGLSELDGDLDTFTSGVLLGLTMVAKQIDSQKELSTAEFAARVADGYMTQCAFAEAMGEDGEDD